MKTDDYGAMKGGCTCGAVRYAVTASPLIVHCCHCTWCQRETGSAFVINAVIENMHVHLTKGEVTVINTPSFSGKGQ
ncbi:GFA family protein, partial [Salmonella enterica]|nr:GFA family protein [Salmonella enterica]